MRLPALRGRMGQPSYQSDIVIEISAPRSVSIDSAPLLPWQVNSPANGARLLPPEVAPWSRWRAGFGIGRSVRVHTPDPGQSPPESVPWECGLASTTPDRQPRSRVAPQDAGPAAIRQDVWPCRQNRVWLHEHTCVQIRLSSREQYGALRYRRRSPESVDGE